MRAMTADEQPSELDRLALGPDAAYAARAPRPPRTPPRRKGDAEAAALRDLRVLPPALRRSALAVSILILARDLDEAAALGISYRDKTGMHRELRQHLNDLADRAPGERTGDSTDAARAARETRLRLVAE